ncbi:MAG TPA: tellurite resistance/C4-dicarboxylate transporter family protein, partial [Anaerolineae bacterium]
MSTRSLQNLLTPVIAGLYPGYFAFVMATGIISIAAYLLEMPPVAWVLFGITQVAFVVLWILTLARLIFFFPRFIADLTDHARGPGFFTLVAGTSVLGRQYILLAGDETTALVLWFLAALLWVVLMYSFFAAVTVRDEKPNLETGLNGGWLLTVVATQSVSLLGTRIANHLPAWQEPILFFTLVLYLIGAALYLFITSL